MFTDFNIIMWHWYGTILLEFHSLYLYLACFYVYVFLLSVLYAVFPCMCGCHTNIEYLLTYLQGVPEKMHKSISTTILQPCTTELCRFQQNVQIVHDNSQCLNMAVKYSLLFSWQVNYLKTKQSTWWHIAFFYHIYTYTHGIYAILGIFWLLEGVSTVKIFSSKNQVWLILLLVIRFFKRLHTFSGFSLSAAARDWTSWRWNTELQIILGSSHNWRMWNSSLSRNLPWTLTGTCPWLSFLTAN